MPKSKDIRHFGQAYRLALKDLTTTRRGLEGIALIHDIIDIDIVHRSRHHDRGDHGDWLQDSLIDDVFPPTYTLVKRSSNFGKFGDLEARQYTSNL